MPGPLMVNSTHVSGWKPQRASVQLSAPPPQEQEKTLPFSSMDSSSVGMRDEELQFVAETTCGRNVVVAVVVRRSRHAVTLFVSMHVLLWRLPL